MRPLIGSIRGEISRATLNTTKQASGITIGKVGTARTIRWTAGSGTVTLGFIIPGSQYYIPRECIVYTASGYFGTNSFDGALCFSNTSITTKNITNLTSKTVYTVSVFSAVPLSDRNLYRINKSIVSNVYTFTM